VQSGPAEILRLVGREQPVDPAPTVREQLAESAKPLLDHLERLGCRPGPVHELAQVLEARVDRLLDERCITGLVTAEHEPLGHDPEGSRACHPSIVRTEAGLGPDA